MRRCSKGKSCGGTCINRNVSCRATLSPNVTNQIERAGDIFLRLLTETKPPRPEAQRLIKALGLGELTQREVGNDFPVLKREAERQLSELRSKPFMTSDEKDYVRQLQSALIIARGNNTKADQSVLLDRIEARDFDNRFRPTNKIGGDYDWSKSYSSGSHSIGGDSLFGTVVASKSPPPEVVKRGEVSEIEAKILEKLNGKDITPRLLSAEINKNNETDREGDISFYEGRVAMSRLEGKSVAEYKFYTDKVGNTTVGDSYFALRKKLHEAGVAHNDGHKENVIIDENGKGRFIDFGRAQDDPRAALSEAMGVLATRSLLPLGVVLKSPLHEFSGDYQSRRYEQFKLPTSDVISKSQTNLAKIIRNRTKVYSELAKLGLSKDEIAELVVHELNQPISSYNKGAWSKVSKKDAIQIIALLYEGVN